MKCSYAPKEVIDCSMCQHVKDCEVFDEYRDILCDWKEG